jgi:hypothetical protein
MRLIVLSISVLAAACSQGPTSPTTPTNATDLAVAPDARPQSQAQTVIGLPFHGTISGTNEAFVTPPTIRIDSSGDGTATQLGQFHAEFSASGTLGDPEGTGPWQFTAANGDTLSAQTSASGVPQGGDATLVTVVATITGGTGRFANATGTFTAVFIGHHTPPSTTGTFSGSFEGTLYLKKRG